MKRCPQCDRVETDKTLRFCRIDGATLVNDSLSLDSEAGTARLGSVSGATETETSILPRTTNAGINRATGPTTVLSAQQPSSTLRALGTPKRRGALIAIAAVIAITIIAGAYRFSLRERNGAAPIESIAVLPFQNKSGDANSEYLSDGLAESLIYRLSQLPNLKVSPTSSVIQYKGKDTKVTTIASELGVDAVLTGRLAQIGDSLTISVELVDVRNNKLLWGEQYDRKITDLLATQREIATAITQKLQLKLSGGERGLTKKYTDNNEAYQLYLKGRFYWNKRDAENLRKAIEQFKAAADKDPNFALAFVGLSDCYLLLPVYSSTPGSEALPQAKAYAERALAIDNSLGEAHTSLGMVHRYLWNWSEAEKELKRGIELNPNYASAHKFYGNVLGNLMRYDEQFAAYNRAQELEPLSLIISTNLAEYYSQRGDFNASVEQCKRGIDLDPNFYPIRLELAKAYLRQGRNAEAVAEAEKAIELSARASNALGTLGYVYSQTGKRSEAAAIIEELKEKFAKGQVSGYDLARVYVGMHEKDRAFYWLERDFQRRNPSMPGWLISYPLDSLRDDPRFKDLTRRIGVPELK